MGHISHSGRVAFNGLYKEYMLNIKVKITFKLLTLYNHLTPEKISKQLNDFAVESSYFEH